MKRRELFKCAALAVAPAPLLATPNDHYLDPCIAIGRVIHEKMQEAVQSGLIDPNYEVRWSGNERRATAHIKARVHATTVKTCITGTVQV